MAKVYGNVKVENLTVGGIKQEGISTEIKDIVEEAELIMPAPGAYNPGSPAHTQILENANDKVFNAKSLEKYLNYLISNDKKY